MAGSLPQSRPTSGQHQGMALSPCHGTVPATVSLYSLHTCSIEARCSRRYVALSSQLDSIEALLVAWPQPSSVLDASTAGACVDEYIVTVTPLGNNNRAFGQAPQRTPQFTVTIQNLENGQPYLFTVQVRVACCLLGLLAASMSQCLLGSGTANRPLLCRLACLVAYL